MSKKNKSHLNSEGNLTDFVDKLVKENNSLKKKIGKLRKMATKAVELEQEDDQEDDAVYKSEELANFKQDLCKLCGGVLKKVVVSERAFSVCQSCKHRVKIEEKSDAPH